jgi:predicted NAD-dependent protein-ADP-ribosyltransferase YbiA (DUF1768 family)
MGGGTSPDKDIPVLFSDQPGIAKMILVAGGIYNKIQAKILVEASPYDKIWGIGMLQSDPNATDHTKWKGLNLLGYILTRVRDDLRKNEVSVQ